MRFIFTICIFAFFSIQSVKGQIDFDKDKLSKSLTDEACHCIDSIEIYDKSKDSIIKEVHECIDKQVLMFQISSELFSNIDIKKELKGTKNSKKKNKETKIIIDTDKNSNKYKDYYYVIERSLMENCESLKKLISANDKQRDNSLTKDKTALEFYNKGIYEAEKGNFQNAVFAYRTSLKFDPNNAFAWDNLGVCYRKLEQYDEAIKAYKQSMLLDSSNETPIMNLAVVYNYQKEYIKAIEMYNKLSVITPDNPEVYYGIGLIYATELKNHEKGLDNLCKAYNLYIKQNSPYRTDAEKVINLIYSEMKDLKKENDFFEILSKNGIKMKK